MLFLFEDLLPTLTWPSGYFSLSCLFSSLLSLQIRVTKRSLWISLLGSWGEKKQDLCSERFPHVSENTISISPLSQKLPVIFKSLFRVLDLEWKNLYVFADNLLCCVRQTTLRPWSFIELFVKLKDWIRSEFLKLGWLTLFQVIHELPKIKWKILCLLMQAFSYNRVHRFHQILRVLGLQKSFLKMHLFESRTGFFCHTASIFQWQWKYSTWHSIEFS